MAWKVVKISGKGEGQEMCNDGVDSYSFGDSANIWGVNPHF
jgi:hypothetical protein